MTPTPRQTLLAVLSGPDRPGLTAALLADLSGEALDVEQVTIQGRLIQAMNIAPTAGATLDDIEVTLRRRAADLGLDVEVGRHPSEDTSTDRQRCRVTLMSAPLGLSALSVTSHQVAEAGGNITRITRVGHHPVTALALDVVGAEVADLRRRLAGVAMDHGFDVSVRRVGLDWRGQHLVVMDVDSTLIQDEVIDLIAEHAGCADEVARVTSEAMGGRLDFAESLTRRVALLQGTPVEVLQQVRHQVRLTPGARTLCRTLRRLGYRIALVSGGFAEIVEPLGAELGVDFVRANHLEVADGRLTGRVAGPIVDRAGKAAALREFAGQLRIPISRTVAIGDGANDLDMSATAGLGVAVNAKPVVRAEADTAVTVPYLDTVLYLLGITREEIEEAMAD